MIVYSERNEYKIIWKINSEYIRIPSATPCRKPTQASLSNKGTLGKKKEADTSGRLEYVSLHVAAQIGIFSPPWRKGGSVILTSVMDTITKLTSVKQRMKDGHCHRQTPVTITIV